MCDGRGEGGGGRGRGEGEESSFTDPWELRNHTLSLPPQLELKRVPTVTCVTDSTGSYRVRTEEVGFFCSYHKCPLPSQGTTWDVIASRPSLLYILHVTSCRNRTRTIFRCKVQWLLPVMCWEVGVHVAEITL